MEVKLRRKEIRKKGAWSSQFSDTVFDNLLLMS